MTVSPLYVPAIAPIIIVWISLGNDQDLTMKFRPLHDRVVLRRIEGEEKTKGGIIIPDTVKRSRRKVRWSPWGQVHGTRRVKINALDVKAGDRACSASGPAPRSRSTVRTS